MSFLIRILMPPELSTQHLPLDSALNILIEEGVIKSDMEIEKTTVKKIAELEWTSSEFISWARGNDEAAKGRKVIFIMGTHPLQGNPPPNWDHLQHLQDMREQLAGIYFTFILSLLCTKSINILLTRL